MNSVASLAALSQRSRELTVKVAGVSKRTRSDHEAIVGAIAARKPKRAHEAMAHLANVRDATLRSRHEAA